MFKSDRLQDVFPSVLHYYFEKIYEAIHGNKPVALGSMHVKLINEIIDSFKIKLASRGILKAYDSINYLLELLEYPIVQLTSYFAGASGSSILDSKNAYIFAFFVEKHLAELKELAEEIDADYEATDTKRTPG